MGSRFIFLFAFLAVMGCNRPADYAVVGSADVPSVHGDVRIEKIDRSHLLITVELDGLPAPGKIEPDLTDYVLWFVVVGETPERKAILEYDAEGRVGRASVPTSLREFEMRVTAENTPTPDAPSYVLIASQQIQEK